ncbi:hypothetical protein METBIDRAFT_35086 [Metschnikowia bicuspidata var. bicuspidata NRRL YB-4993]|uniref:Pre-mRNA-splicing factor SLU7 n=1 Tax=Metschnikowia bicuspidata var. bicuspidata NRRL YB-4993 TaxID=869754 RepID=A0A1A0HFL7_9ASCO|nr:hypothetical protein METBIDRAFT_35086 [Metschnikowia bicuspidata var. bicuspidata NRRL YB-4993]OBA22780.1 hypothetical protein METBIDRAFT_35086 [Metschnikowia bicuspidata var. bicuspidata NRRL YB-4993]
MALGSNNLYIPKYILDVPWYYKSGLKAEQAGAEDTLAHHRKTPGQAPVHHSEPQAGAGIFDEVTHVNGTKTRVADDYDAKRDRWHGHSADEWDEILTRWEAVKKTASRGQNMNEDSDDTDYELELEELGLSRSDLKTGHVEDPLEKSIRDRRDVPAYIRAINGNMGGKIRVGKDSTVGVVNEDSEFVKESADVAEFRQAQKFAWEKNKAFEAEQKKAHYDAQLASLKNPNVPIEEQPAADLNFSMEASPTMMMLQNRQNEQRRKDAGEAKRRRLMEMYGS